MGALLRGSRCRGADCQPARRRLPRDGYSRPYVAAVAYASAFYGLLALLLSAQAVRLLSAHWRKLGPRAMPAAVLVWIGTPLLFYMYIAPPMSHATSAFAVALFVVIWLRVRDDWSLGGLIALGAPAALMAMVREQDAFFAVGPAIDFLHAQATRRDGRTARRFAHAVAGIAPPWRPSRRRRWPTSPSTATSGRRDWWRAR